MHARLFDVTAPRIERGNVVARCRVIGAAGHPPSVRLDGHVAETGSRFLIAPGTLECAEFLVQFDQRSLAKRVVAGRDVFEFAAILDVSRVLCPAQVVHVPEACVGTDDEQPFGS